MLDRAVSAQTPVNAPVGTLNLSIVGLPGETVSIVDGTVHIDGAALEEPYVAAENVSAEHSRAFPPTPVPPGHYFMMGDNRDNSMDSRFQPMTRREDITGKVVRAIP